MTSPARSASDCSRSFTTSRAEVEPALALALEEAKQQRARAEAQLGDPIDPALGPHLTGAYSNPALGTVIVALAGGALVADAGEFRVVLHPLRSSRPKVPPSSSQPRRSPASPSALTPLAARPALSSGLHRVNWRR